MTIKEGQYPGYRYEMGFMVENTAIPDPSEYKGSVSVIDTLDKTDATGYQHRCVVAEKRTLKIKYQNISWTMIKNICSLMAYDKFKFSFPDPATGTVTMDAHASDVGWEVVTAVPGCEPIGNLVFSVNEY